MTATVGTLEAIYRYPVKSFGGEALGSVDLVSGCGLPLDRTWAFVSPGKSTLSDGTWVPCSNFERLTIRPELAGMTAIATTHGVRIGAEGSTRTLREEEAFDLEGRHVVLARAQAGYWDHADATLSIVNLATVREIERVAGGRIEPERFRGNLLIEAEPWSEFGWLGHELHMDDAVLDIVRPTDR